MNQCYELLNNYIKNNSTVVLACSGGPDSMCLYDLLLSMKKQKNLRIVLAHVNHNIRENSIDDQEFVKEESMKNGDIFEFFTIEKNSKYNESDYRNFRYDFFRDTIKKYSAGYLLTAHHGDDLIETVMMRIVRGSNLNGYSGIKSVIVKDEYTVLRPLIYLTKDEILKYDNDNNVAFVHDYTNDLDDYTRNRYRHHLLPFLKSEDKEVHKRFLKYSQELQENEDFINRIIEKYELETIEDDKIIVENFIQLDSFVQKRIVNNLLKKIYKNELYNVNDKNIYEIIKNIVDNPINKTITLPKGYEGIISYGKFYIAKGKSIQDFNILFTLDNIDLSNGYILRKVEESDEKSNYVLRLDSSEIKLPLYVRNRKLGDFIEVKGLNGTKKVKDIFINEKIENSLRDEWPILVDDDDNVLWIPGIKKSKFDKEKNEKCDIIIKYEKEREYEK